MIKAVHVENNAIVKAGQLLAELDDETLRHEYSRAEAQVAVARAKLVEAEALEVGAGQELSRKSTLARRNLAPQRDLDNASADAAQRKAATQGARAELAAAQAALAMSRSSLAKSRILSPIDGIVLRRNVEPGQTIAASLAAPVLFRLAQSLDRMQIRVDVDEADVMKVKSGQPATFSVQAMRERQFEARVEKLFVGPEVVQGVVTYKAILSFDNAGLDLKPGMTAAAEIVVERVQGGVLVPNAALRFSPPDAATQPPPGTGIALATTLVRAASPDEAQAATDAARGADGGAGRVHAETGRVFIERVGALTPVLVETGATDGVRTIILSGPLTIGQKVVVDLADQRR
jgi:HlyD family secretion protein